MQWKPSCFGLAKHLLKFCILWYFNVYLNFRAFNGGGRDIQLWVCYFVMSLVFQDIWGAGVVGGCPRLWGVLVSSWSWIKCFQSADCWCRERRAECKMVDGASIGWFGGGLFSLQCGIWSLVAISWFIKLTADSGSIRAVSRNTLSECKICTWIMNGGRGM